jgi:ribosome-associated protein
LALDRHCTDIVVLDLRRLSPVTDFFLIATGTSNRQMASLAAEMDDTAALSGHKAFSIGGLPKSTWVLIDFIDVVVHLFDADSRSYYDLEMLWGDAPKTRWKRPRPKRPSTKA